MHKVKNFRTGKRAVGAFAGGWFMVVAFIESETGVRDRLAAILATIALCPLYA
jgi:hypothetical protein